MCGLGHALGLDLEEVSVRLHHVVGLGTLALFLCLARPAQALTLRVGAGADYWLAGDGTALFEANLGAMQKVFPHLSIGGRTGIDFATGPNLLGVPIDLQAHIGFDHIYFEGLVGPWIFFANDPVRAHAAIGFGAYAGPLDFGLEVGYLSPSPLIGVRIGFRF
jgi:hypothetical protein